MPALANLYAAVESASENMGLLRRHLYGVLTDSSPGSVREHDYRGERLAKVLYATLTCLPLLVVCYLFWRRIRDARWQDLREISWIRALVYISYLIGIAFFITAVVITGVGIHSPRFCRTAIYFCIGFLFTGKFFMQMFLIERAHVANINYLRRRDDPMWIVSMAAVVIGGTALIVWAFLNPVAYIANEDGRCRKGLPAEVVAPGEIYEVISYIVLTGVFVRMLRRTRQCELFPKVPERYTTVEGAVNHWWRKVQKAPTAENLEVQEIVSNFAPNEVILPASSQPSRLRGLAWKSLVGTILILGCSIITSVIFYIKDGREHVWLCFTQCTMDIFLSICVLHWLTANSKDYEHGLRGTRLSVTELPVFLRGDSVSESNQFAESGQSEKAKQAKISVSSCSTR